MNYLQTLPKELTTIILIYLKPVDIQQLSKELDFYVNYESLLMYKYPVNYTHIRRLIMTYELEYYYYLLDYLEFDDDTHLFIEGRKGKQIQDKHQHNVYELIAQIHLDNYYGPKLRSVLPKLPDDEYKHSIIVDLMIDM